MRRLISALLIYRGGRLGLMIHRYGSGVFRFFFAALVSFATLRETKASKKRFSRKVAETIERRKVQTRPLLPLPHRLALWATKMIDGCADLRIEAFNLG